jgi:predicted nucleic acid-binding protein
MSGLEYRFSASNEVQWDLLAEVLDGFAREPFGAEVFERADEVQRLLAAASLKRRKPPDLLIAAQAEIAKLTVVHYDRDYDYISSVTGQPTLWIVAPGTID